ncbi:Protein kinase-like domain protein [Akanthomyces lecanii RCEF 1005]|uniref:Protein kinase-like domain protein n=1 Tax=Akanthomyces lecanii RCEF 1005 TaxID=1081108 RepID=A0A162J1D4_CORDF|nr:Protein kinase-like domain protein [Akanthomyces lecanii RCEF 1005]
MKSESLKDTESGGSGSATNVFLSNELQARVAAAADLNKHDRLNRCNKSNSAEEETTNAIPSEEIQKHFNVLNKFPVERRVGESGISSSDSFSILTIKESDVGPDARVVICPLPPDHIPTSSLEAVVLPAVTGQSLVVARQSPDNTDFTLDLENGRSCRFFYDELHLLALGTDEADGKFGQSASVQAQMIRPISPGYWRIAKDKNGKPDKLLTELLLFRRRYSLKKSSQITAAAGSKRPVSEDADTAVAVRSTSLELISRDNPMLEVRQTTKLSVISSDAVDLTVANLRDIVDRNATMVFRGMHSKFGDSVVKVIRKREYSSETHDVISLVRMWRREVQFMASMKHDSIVKFYGADGRFYTIFMEYLPYPDLSAICEMRNRQFSGTDQDAVRVLRDSSSALAYLAERKIMHNDIKPGNILYDKTRGAVLIDFGMVSVDGFSRPPGGTPHYMAPKSAEDGGRVLGSDVFSLGVTMLYLLKMTPLPEATARAWDLDNMHCQPAQDWRANVGKIRQRLSTDGVEGIVSKMLEGKPRNRISAAAITGLLASYIFVQS